VSRAAPHLWRRLRRWLALRHLSARAQQLQAGIAGIEERVDHDLTTLGAMRMDLRQVQLRLRAAQQHTANHVPVGWGL